MGTLGRRALTAVLFLPAILFTVMGLRWLVDPAGIAPDLGLTLEQGLGLSSQVGDLAAFFLVAGISLLIALVTKQRSWFYPTAMLLGFAALGRTVAWVAHDAALAPHILFEVIVALLILAGAKFLPESSS